MTTPSKTQDQKSTPPSADVLFKQLDGTRKQALEGAASKQTPVTATAVTSATIPRILAVVKPHSSSQLLATADAYLPFSAAKYAAWLALTALSFDNEPSPALSPEFLRQWCLYANMIPEPRALTIEDVMRPDSMVSNASLTLEGTFDEVMQHGSMASDASLFDD